MLSICFFFLMVLCHFLFFIYICIASQAKKSTNNYWDDRVLPFLSAIDLHAVLNRTESESYSVARTRWNANNMKIPPSINAKVPFKFSKRKSGPYRKLCPFLSVSVSQLSQRQQWHSILILTYEIRSNFHYYIRSDQIRKEVATDTRRESNNDHFSSTNIRFFFLFQARWHCGRYFSG
jgi:hypothetical protein